MPSIVNLFGNLAIQQSVSWSYQFTTNLNLTGYTGQALLRENFRALTGIPLLVEFIDRSPAIIKLSLSAVQTASIVPRNYVFDVVATDPAGQQIRLIYGKTIVVPAMGNVTNVAAIRSALNLGTAASLNVGTIAGTLPVLGSNNVLADTVIPSTIARNTDLSNALSGYQPIDSDLTAIAALTTNAFGRSLLGVADAAATRSVLGLGSAALSNIIDFATTSQGSKADSAVQPAALSNYQPIDSDLTAIAALTTNAFGRSLLTLPDLATAKTTLNIPSSSSAVVRQTFNNADVSIAAGTTQLAQTGTLTAPRSITVPLASSVSAGFAIDILGESGTATISNKLVLLRSGSDTLNGATTLDAITTAYGTARLISDGVSKWLVFFSKLTTTAIASLTSSVNPIFLPLTVTCPTHYQIFQRNRATNKGLIVIEGSTAIADTIQVQWKSGGWVDVGTITNPGNFSFSLSDQSVGQGDLEIRLKNNPDVYLFRKYVGIGALILAVGQSNMAGLGDNRQSPSLVYGGTLKAGLSLKSGWIEAVDPHSRNAGRDSVSWNGNDLISIHGSYMPIVAGYFLNQAIPVGIIHAAKSGTLIDLWLPGANQQDTTTLFGQALKRALDGSKTVGCEMILWHQGESDAQVSTSTSIYQSKLITIGETFATALNCRFFPCKLQNCTEATAAAGQDAINAGIAGAIAVSPLIEQGADLSSITTDSDGLHLKNDLSLYKAATFWWNAIASFFGYSTVAIPTTYPTPAIDPAPTGTFVTLTSPATFQVFQRDRLKKLGSIVVSGSINATDSVEWRWRKGIWQTLITSVNGVFAKVIPNQPIGQGDFEVRAASNPSVVTKVKMVSVGVIWLTLGGATQSGRSQNQQWYAYTEGGSALKASVYGNNGFAELKDAVNSVSIGKYSIESDTLAAGSYLPLLAGYYLDQNIPVAIIPVAIGGVQIASFVPSGNTKDTTTLFGAANSKALTASLGAGIEGVLIDVGINDAVSNTSLTSYKTSANAIANAFVISLRCQTYLVRQPRSSNTSYHTNLVNNINPAIDQLVNENSNILLGGNLFELITDDDTAQFPGQLIIGDANLISVAQKIFEGLNGGASIDLGHTKAPIVAIGALPAIINQVATYNFTVTYNAK